VAANSAMNTGVPDPDNAVGKCPTEADYDRELIALVRYIIRLTVADTASTQKAAKSQR